MTLRALLLCLLTACAAPRASMPAFGSGPMLNLTSDRAITNASAHVAWSVAIPLAGLAVDGRRGMRAAAAAWIAETLLSEALFHAPPGPLGPEYASEVRTDLLTKIAPALLLLAIDQLRPAAERAP